ncbi:RNHCP domain-containing protein [Thalassiella azotivora]
MPRKTENSGFTCAACGRAVAPIRHGTIRDHCPFCLCSLHVDDVPGDRACDCHGVLRPVGTDYRGAKGHIVLYECERCGQARRNRVAPDDDLDVLLAVQARQADRLLP